MVTTRQSKERGSSERRAVILHKLVGEGCTAVVTSEHNPEGQEGLPLSSLWGKYPKQQEQQVKMPQGKSVLGEGEEQPRGSAGGTE